MQVFVIVLNLKNTWENGNYGSELVEKCQAY